MILLFYFSPCIKAILLSNACTQRDQKEGRRLNPGALIKIPDLTASG